MVLVQKHGWSKDCCLFCHMIVLLQFTRSKHFCYCVKLTFVMHVGYTYSRLIETIQHDKYALNFERSVNIRSDTKNSCKCYH